ncbi:MULTISPECIES: DUF4198 domain-containing protein [unclassified Sphingomonas]|uniref:DUF4198 domain-containing protein n=1 Tax=unclassified Sphingomonas TaxID=196159 RepID=UPI0006FD0588|nr:MULTISPECIES: DUF4198 domain-containing protein [unclassified Sphingomonas]KQM62300.1 hypothetical protein ASE65_04685 [Sphingomonas sp. Leaf16]KQN13704.1 hypothetical protein ASE81_04755 [Sphingomonas sp. Leaf29]KQN23066.1 hypothetical protein ASE83_00655 [Sphingomonas sp. Leaf32]
MQHSIGIIRAGSAALALALASTATAALAHMPYVLPARFDVGSHTQITLEASFTEDAFRPEVAMRDAPFEITGPDGRTERLPPATLAGDRTIAEAALPVDGIYRLSSRQRSGRAGKMYRKDRDWIMVGEGTAPPQGVQLVDVRSMTLADAYVLRGRPGAPGALAPRGTALEIQPLGDPTILAPGSAARFAVLYDGKPLPGQAVTLFREAGLYDGRKQVGTATSDGAGVVVLTAPDPGRYLMLVRYRTATPDVAGGYASFTTTLAFEVG